MIPAVQPNSCTYSMIHLLFTKYGLSFAVLINYRTIRTNRSDDLSGEGVEYPCNLTAAVKGQDAWRRYNPISKIPRNLRI